VPIEFRILFEEVCWRLIPKLFVEAGFLELMIQRIGLFEVMRVAKLTYQIRGAQEPRWTSIQHQVDDLPAILSMSHHRQTVRILHLDPIPARAGAVGRAQALRHDALQAHAAGLPEDRGAVVGSVLAHGILRLVVTLRTKKRKNSSSARHYDQISFRFHTGWTDSGHSNHRRVG
jgi:hypothetical protein